MNARKISITASLFMTGAAGLVVEYVLSTVSSYIIGNSIQQFSMTIAIMLGFMGLGGFAQKFVSDKGIINKFIYLEVILAVVSGFAPIAVYAAFTYFPHHFTIIYYLFVMSIGFMVGFEIPFITRINERFSYGLKENLSIVFAADYIGALFGAIAFVYLLLPYLPLTKIGFIVAGLNFVVAVITFMVFAQGGLKVNMVPMTTIAVVGVLFVIGYNNVLNWTKVVEQGMFKDPIVDSTLTPYQSLTVTHAPDTNDTRLYINRKTQFSSLDEHRYHELLVHLPASGAKELKRTLVIGGGDGLAVRELLKYPEMSIDLIELDEKMIGNATENLINVVQKESHELSQDAREKLTKSLQEASGFIDKLAKKIDPKNE